LEVAAEEEEEEVYPPGTSGGEGEEFSMPDRRRTGPLASGGGFFKEKISALTHRLKEREHTIVASPSPAAEVDRRQSEDGGGEQERGNSLARRLSRGPRTR
jgi:hypothetical protein